MMTRIEKALTENPSLSIRRIANATGATYSILLKASKKPVEGEIYDAGAINYEAVEDALIRKLSVEGYEALDFSSMVDTTTKPTASKTLPEWIEEGSLMYLKSTSTSKFESDFPYKLLYQTFSHVVILSENSSEPRVLSIASLIKAKPSTQPHVQEEPEVEQSDEVVPDPVVKSKRVRKALK